MRTTFSISLALLLAVLSSSSAVLAQAGPSPSSEPVASQPPATPDKSVADPTVAFEQPSWKRVAPARGPAAREDHTWTVDADGRYAYLFGGRDGGNEFDDLWRYDLASDSWERLSPRGNGPQARFGHSAVWVDGRGLIVFAGQQGTDFFGDLWQFDPERGSWRQLPADGAAPRARYGSCMVVGRDGRLWISHGFTFAGRFDDTRAYNLKSTRWTSIAPDGRRPGERCLHDCFTTASGELVLYGGQDNSQRALGDLWATRRDGSWRKLANPRLQARRLYAVTEAGDYAYIFGGAGRDDGAFDDLWRVDRRTLESRRVRIDGSGPAARYAATLVSDPIRGRLLLFGGRDASARDDVWELVDAGADPAAGIEATSTPVEVVASAEASPSPEG
jgi:N-acetylneuraminic acid mutarotase